MGFVRIKTIKGNKYAYLVENTWKKKGSRQKVTAYLGKVLEFPVRQSAPAPNMTGTFQSCIHEIIAWQFLRLGFRRKGDTLIHGKISFFVPTLSFTKKGKPTPLVIKNHEGYLCTPTLTTLRSFSMRTDGPEAGLFLAKAVVDAGIEIPKEIFVALYEKASNRNNDHDTLKPAKLYNSQAGQVD